MNNQSIKLPKNNQFLHLVGIKVANFINSPSKFFTTYASIAYLTTYALMDTQMGTLGHLALSFPVAALTGMASFLITVPALTLIERFFKQNSGNSTLAAAFNTDSYWMKSFKNLVEKVDNDCRSLSVEEKKEYKNKVMAQIFLLKRKMFTGNESRYLQFIEKNSMLMNKLEENLKLNVSAVYEIEAQMGALAKQGMSDNTLVPYIREELKNQPITALDILFDLKLLSEIEFEKKEHRGNLDILLFLYQTCLQQRHMEKNETKDMLSLMGRIKSASILKEVIDATVNSAESDHPMDLGLLSDFIKKNQSFSAAVCQEWLEILKKIKPEISVLSQLNNESVQTKAPNENFLITEQAIPAEVIPLSLMAQLSVDKIEGLVRKSGLDSEASQALTHLLSKLSTTLTSINSNAHLMDVEDKIQLKVDIVNALPFMLESLTTLSNWPEEVRQEAASMIGTTLELLQEKSSVIEARVQNNFLNQLEVLTRQHRSSSTALITEGLENPKESKPPIVNINARSIKMSGRK